MKGILCWANAGGGKLLHYRMKDGETKTVGTLHRMGTGYTGWFDESPPWVYCSQVPQTTAHHTQPGGGRSIDRRSWQPLSPHLDHDSVFHRHTPVRTVP